MRIAAIIVLYAIFMGHILVLMHRVKDLERSISKLAYVDTIKDKKLTTIDNLDLFIEAIIYVESRGDINAIGTNNDTGVLQITPIYVAEANQIIGVKGHYTINDCFDKNKSIEIFKVVNSYHNPTRDFYKAITLHNPGAGPEYAHKIITKYNELCKIYLEK